MAYSEEEIIREMRTLDWWLRVPFQEDIQCTQLTLGEKVTAVLIDRIQQDSDDFPLKPVRMMIVLYDQDPDLWQCDEDGQWDAGPNPDLDDKDIWACIGIEESRYMPNEMKIVDEEVLRMVESIFTMNHM